MNAIRSQRPCNRIRIPRRAGIYALFLSTLLCTYVPTAQSREPIDWRSNGAGLFSGERATKTWGKSENIAWQKTLPEPSNATPIILKDRIIVMVEPTTIMALNRTDGATMWSRSISILDTYSGQERVEMERRAKSAQSAYENQDQNKRKLYRLKRLERRGRLSSEQSESLGDLEQEIFRADQEWKKYQLFLAPPPIQWIGYTSASPLVDGRHIYVVLGTAVVAKLTTKGDLVWAKRVGSPPSKMNGFQMGSSASPVLVDGVLIVGMTHLFGIAPKTGEVLWKGAQYKDFGTPAIMRQKTGPLLITPSGDVIRPKDGSVLASGLGEVWFSSPIVHKDVVYFVGSSGTQVEAVEGGKEEHKMVSHGQKTATARAVQVRLNKDGTVSWKKLWETPLSTDNYFSSPATDGNVLYAVSYKCEVFALDLGSGTTLFSKDLHRRSFDDVYASPMIVGDRVYILESHGSMKVLKTGRSFHALETNFFDGRFIGSAFIRGGQVAMRSADKIILTAPP